MVSKHRNRKFAKVVSLPVSAPDPTPSVFKEPEMNEQALVCCTHILPFPAEKIVIDGFSYDRDLPRFRKHLDIEWQVIVPSETLVEANSVGLQKMPAVKAPPDCRCLKHHRIRRSGDDAESRELNGEPFRVLPSRAILRVHVEKLSL